MRPDAVVVVEPIGDEYLGFEQGGEAFAVQQFVPELAIKRFDVAVFPGTARLDEERLDLSAAQPVLHGVSTKLRTVIATEVLGRTPADEQVA